MLIWREGCTGAGRLGLALHPACSCLGEPAVTKQKEAFLTRSTFTEWFAGPLACRNRKALIELNSFPECLFQQQQKETLLFGIQPSRPLGTYSA